MYRPAAANILVADQLSGILKGKDGQSIKFEANAKNTLFALINGFRALNRRIQELLDKPKVTYRKGEIALAHFCETTNIQLFPYRHQHFVCDLGDSDQARISQMLEDTTTRLELSGAMSIRNRLDHPSDTFPTSEEIVRCCEDLRATVSQIESFGLVPVVYAMSRFDTDSAGRVTVYANDYRANQRVWTRCSALQCIRSLPNVQEPQILVPGIRIPGTGEILRFKIQEESEYTAIWKGYPRYGKIDVGPEAEPHSKVTGEQLQEDTVAGPP